MQLQAISILYARWLHPPLSLPTAMAFDKCWNPPLEVTNDATYAIVDHGITFLWNALHIANVLKSCYRKPVLYFSGKAERGVPWGLPRGIPFIPVHLNLKGRLDITWRACCYRYKASPTVADPPILHVKNVNWKKKIALQSGRLLIACFLFARLTC